MVKYDHSIPPGGKGNITLRVNTKNRRGKLTKRALVITNDPANKGVKISISGTVKALISVEPRPYVFLTGLPEDEITGEVRLLAEEVPSFKIKKTTDNLKGKIEYKLITVKEGKEYILRVKNRYKKQGSYYGEIDLLTDNPKKPKIRIRVSGRIRGELEAIPRVVYFGRVASTSDVPPQRLTRQLIVRSLKKRAFNIVALDYNKKLFNIEIENEENRKDIKRLKIVPLLNNMKKGANYDLLKIKTDVKTSPELSIGLRIFVD